MEIRKISIKVNEQEMMLVERKVCLFLFLPPFLFLFCFSIKCLSFNMTGRKINRPLSVWPISSVPIFADGTCLLAPLPKWLRQFFFIVAPFLLDSCCPPKLALILFGGKQDFGVMCYARNVEKDVVALGFWMREVTHYD